MKKLNKIYRKLNDLLLINYEAERIYLEALDIVKNENLKMFFRERGFERNEYGRQLRSEIKNFGGDPQTLDELSNDYYKIWISFKNYLEKGAEEEMFEEIHRIKDLSIKAYDETLRLHRLPPSVCKTLIDQRDKIEISMNSIRVRERLVA